MRRLIVRGHTIVTTALLAALAGCNGLDSAIDDPPAPPDIDVTSGSAAQEDHAPEAEALLVAFRPELVATEREAALSEAGLLVKAASSADAPFVRVVPRAGRGIQAPLKALARDTRVRVVEPDLPLKVAAIPNDPSFLNQWELHNVGQFGGSTPDADIDAPEAWDVNTDCGSVPVAVLDTGVNYGDPDLASNIRRDSQGQLVGYDFLDGDDDPSDLDLHGTGVAKLVGAVGNNGIGMTGVCQSASIIPIRVTSYSVSGTTSTAIAGIDYARAQGAKIINISLTQGPQFSQLMYEALERARDAGILVVIAAGNDAQNSDVSPLYPASYNQYLDNVISVGATTWGDAVASYSRHGLSVDIMAPAFSGTSFAAPLVAGSAALVAATYPQSAGYLELKQRIFAGVDHPPATIGRVRTGRLNVGSSMKNDTVAPGAPSNLRITKRASTELVLEWSASGDDGSAGGAASAYELRYSTKPIESFDEATEVVHAMIPATPGAPEAYVLTGLAPATTYWVALRAVDKVGNRSPIVSPSYGIRTAPSNILLFDGAEGPTPAFAGTGLWAVSSEDKATGENAYTDSPGVPMASFTESALTQISPVTLTGALPILQFRAKLDLNPNDKLHVQLSRDSGATWLDVRDPLSGSLPWRTHRVMLHAFENDSVLVRFNLAPLGNSDGLQGVWLDDIQITSAPGASCQIDDGAEPMGRPPPFASFSWAASSDEVWSGGFAYSASPGAPYPPSSTRSLLQTSPLTLTGSDPWFASVTKSALGQGDLLTLNVSNDGGTSWSLLNTDQATYFTYFVGAQPWTYRTTSLTRYRNQSFRIRWDLTSDADHGGELGAWVDDIALCSEAFEAIADPPGVPAAATNLQVTASDYAQRVYVQWTDSSKFETGYLVQRRIAGGQWTDIGQVGKITGIGSSYVYTDYTAVQGTSEYRVVSLGALGATVTAPVSVSLGCYNCQ